ncbi:MAG: hypothetical protein GY888_17775 [Planctomycetaceae bacterium]|nr:hypothetical protein [Planctomycetaceae bacterium]
MNHNRYNNNPFNFVPRYRVPGKINLNTIYSRDVWEGLMGRVYSSGKPGVSWGEFKKSRKRKQPPAGGPGGPATGINLNSFEFAGVFRNANEGNYVPDLSTTPPSTGPTLVREGFDCGLFRRHPDDDGQQLPQAGDAPLFVFNAVDPYNHTNRSAYFAYDLRQRLGNLVTTRSSVFAIWITVGLFEVNAQGQVTPNELGSDSGEVRRSRGFFVLDRSIPVAFEPGKNHNVERAIRVSSFIE